MIKKILVTTILSIVSFSISAKVDPARLRECATGVNGRVTGLYADVYNKKVAIKVGDNFYYVAYHTSDDFTRAAYNSAMMAYASGANLKILECKGNDINSIEINE